MENSKKIKLYIADSENDNILNYFSKKDEYEVVGSSQNGQDVIKDVEALKPDFLITEVMLSGMDGFMVLENLKKQMKEMPKVIFISNLSHSGFISKAIKEGASYFMVKPIIPENLEERIKDLMSDNNEKEIKNEKQLDEKISNIFISIGIPAHIKAPVPIQDPLLSSEKERNRKIEKHIH